MKTLKLLSLLVFSLFLVGTASAVVVYSEWQDSSQSITITEGNTASFYAEVFSIKSDVNLNVKMYNSNSALVYLFEQDTQVNKGDLFSKQYNISPTIYQNSGDYSIIVTASDSIGTQSKTLTLKVNPVVIIDTTAPVITLLGNNPETVVVGNTYIDAGATALDNADGDITSQIVVVNPVNVNVVGIYTITYSVSDAAGNTATATRTVSVVSTITDTTAPVITLVGSNPINVALGTSYVDAGATALDNIDGNITSQIVVLNPVDTNTIGIYTISYNVQDSAGNSAVEVTRIVNVYNPGDITPPVITVITPEQNRRYTNTNIVFDIRVNEVAEVEFSIDGKSNVTMDFQGMTNGILKFTYNAVLSKQSHTIIFYATDAAGNTESKKINFVVGTSNSSDQNKITIKTVGEINTDEQAYLNQFGEKPTISLVENESVSVPSSWQKFLKWFPFLLIGLIILLTIGMIIVRRNYRTY